MRTKLLALLMVLGIALAGCAGTTSSSSSGSEPVEGTRSPSKQFRYVDYDDIFIPNEMSYKADDSFFIGTGSDKLGLMYFTGSVEYRSLAQTLISNMANDAWTLNFNFVSSPRSVLIFSKANRFCVMKINDTRLRTELSVDVYPINGQERVMRPVITPSMGGNSGMSNGGMSNGGSSQEGTTIKEEGLSQ